MKKLTSAFADNDPGTVQIRPSWMRSKLARWPLILYKLRLGALISRKLMVLTTVGRATGRNRSIPLWYYVEEDTIFCFSGWGRGSDWAKNLAVNPQVRITIGRTNLMAEGSIVESSDTQTRILQSFQQKYGRRTVKLFYHLDRLELVAFPLDRTSEE